MEVELRDMHPVLSDLMNFTIRDTTECGRTLRRMGEGARSLEEVAGRTVKYLYDTLIDGQTGGRACSLVRFFKTCPFARLDDRLAAFAREMLGASPVSPEMKCLTLFGTIGEDPLWNSRKSSQRHQVIPLPSEQAVLNIPMMRNLLKQLGMDVSIVVKPDRKLILEMEQRNFNVFLVQDAPGSPYIPAQEEFVVRYGIKSVLGFGGLLPSGDIFIVIMFTKARISRETADMFKNLALNVKLAILPFETGVFI